MDQEVSERVGEPGGGRLCVSVWLFRDAGALYTDAHAHGTRFNTLNERGSAQALPFTHSRSALSPQPIGGGGARLEGAEANLPGGPTLRCDAEQLGPVGAEVARRPWRLLAFWGAGAGLARPLLEQAGRARLRPSRGWLLVPAA